MSIKKFKDINLSLKEESFNFDKKWQSVFKVLILMDVAKPELWNKEKLKNVLFDLITNEIESRIKNAE